MTPGCSASGTSIPIAAVLERRLVPCPSCRVSVTDEVFPAFLRPLEQGVSGGLTDEQYVRNVVDIVFRTRGGAAGG